jgi:hypothetical protein
MYETAAIWDINEAAELLEWESTSTLGGLGTVGYCTKKHSQP